MRKTEPIQKRKKNHRKSKFIIPWSFGRTPKKDINILRCIDYNNSPIVHYTQTNIGIPFDTSRRYNRYPRKTSVRRCYGNVRRNDEGIDVIWLHIGLPYYPASNNIICFTWPYDK